VSQSLLFELSFAMEDAPRDLVKSMKGGVATLLVVAWNAPLVVLLLSKGFSWENALFCSLMAMQVGLLVIASLVVAHSAAAHRWVFRPEVPVGYFRRPLRVGAVAYAAMGIVMGGLSLVEG
jgi:hypothetical protein